MFLTQPPDAPGPSIFGTHAYQVPTPASDLLFTRYNDFLRDFVAEHPEGVSLVDLASYVCPGGPPCAANRRRLHPTLRRRALRHPGAVWAAEWLIPRLAR